MAHAHHETPEERKRSLNLWLIFVVVLVLIAAAALALVLILRNDEQGGNTSAVTTSTLGAPVLV
jgi:flagellar basal body-associated protein FliL